MEWTAFFAKLQSIFQIGLLASIGGVAKYFYDNVRKKKPFDFAIFFSFVILAFFTGNLMGAVFDSSYKYRDGLIMLSGFSCYPVLGMLEDNLIKRFRKYRPYE